MRCYLFLLILFSPILSYSQPTFGYYYTNTLGGNEFTYSVLVGLSDGNVIGTNTNSVSTHFTLFKIDAMGNMLWKKTIHLDNYQIVTPYNMILLNDSTIAIHVEIWQTSDFAIIKCDLEANVIWSKIYSGIPYFMAEISPYENGGLVVAETDYIIFINSDGSVKNALETPSGFSIWESTYVGNSIVKVMGVNSTNDIFLFDVDSSGIVSNSYRHILVSLPPTGGTYLPFENMVTSSTGSTMVMRALGGGYYGVINFNSQNQSLWAKKVSAHNPRNIVATADGGCITSSHADSTAPIMYGAMFCKFDSIGNMEWTKAPLDSINPTQGFNIHSMTTDGGTGWYCVLHRLKMHVFHTDSVINGFCQYQNVQPTVSNIQLISSVMNFTLTPVTVSDSAIAVTLTSVPWYRYDACTGVLIDSTTGFGELQHMNLQVYPNPVSDILNISFSQKINTGTISIYNMLGEKVIETGFINQSETELNIARLNPGIYFVIVQSEKQRFVARVLKN